MLLHIRDVLKPDQIAECRRMIDRADWVDGRRTATFAEFSDVKNNQEVSQTDPAALQMGTMILAALSNNPLFVQRALPIKICPPLFNRYTGGENYATHTDSGLLQQRPPNLPLRSDLSATLFLTAPADYDGGELVIEDNFGRHSIKLPAGDMIVYPASSLHHVEPVTRGARVSSFFWIQSAIRSDAQRMLLTELQSSIDHMRHAVPGNPGIMELMGVYSNLLRLWSET